MLRVHEVVRRKRRPTVKQAAKQLPIDALFMFET
jgi:hypothetical protein